MMSHNYKASLFETDFIVLSTKFTSRLAFQLLGHVILPLANEVVFTGFSVHEVGRVGISCSISFQGVGIYGTRSFWSAWYV